MQKDYYKTLGVSEKATAAEIKAAFRRLSKKYHPDLNKGDKKAEERFKEVSEAYEVLGKEKERKKYDEARSNAGSFNFKGFSQDGPFRSSDIFDELFKNTGFSKGVGGFSNVFNGFDFSSLGDLFGRREGKGSNRRSHRPIEVEIPLKQAMMGGSFDITGLPCGKQSINVPKGSADGTVIKLSAAGSTYNIVLKLIDDEPFKINGKDIETTICINIVQAVLGSRIKIKAPNGESLIVTVPPGSKSNDILRLRGQGMQGGSLLVKIEVDIPKKLSETEKGYFTELAAKMKWRH